MHLLTAKPGGFSEDEGIIDLQQTPGDIVILAGQDTTLSILARCSDGLEPDYPALRLANFIHLTKPAAFDLYADKVLEKARVIILSLLGGKNYLPYGVEQLTTIVQRTGAKLVIVPGDDQADEDLFSCSTIPRDQVLTLWRYLREGGYRNILNFYRFIRFHLLADHAESAAQTPIEPPEPLPRVCHVEEVTEEVTKGSLNTNGENPVLLLFYRSHLQAGLLEPFIEFTNILIEQGMSVIPVSVASLKEADCRETVEALARDHQARLILNTTAFSIHSFGNAHLSSTPTDTVDTGLLRLNIPVFQVILAANSLDDWQAHPQGLRPRDIAMNIALPEMDGRIITRAVAFKAELRRNERCQYDIIQFELCHERARFIAGLALKWARLANTPNPQKRIALVLANYPTKDGRIGNGVGLDTPQSTLNILRAMTVDEYAIADLPETGSELIHDLQSMVTNNPEHFDLKGCAQSIAIEQYRDYFAQLPPQCQDLVLERWGNPEADPKYRMGRLMISGVRYGETFVGIQPARGFNLDLMANYHDPDLVPPHSYLAFYFWLRHVYQIDAIVHVGKHGNLEWLPGKGAALGPECWPEIALGPLPHFYPFIVNDPGEGAQAKRRAQAVILDHLMPPMARAELYGDLEEIEHLADELYQAMGMDARRETFLRAKLVKRITETDLLQELTRSSLSNGSSSLPDNTAEPEDELILANLDAYLCDLKEAQIRDGLHSYGERPDLPQLAETLLALVRIPRGENDIQDWSILDCLAQDLKLKAADFNPLANDLSAIWTGPKPSILAKLDTRPWRTAADTRDRLEQFALSIMTALLSGQINDGTLAGLPLTRRLLEHVEKSVYPALVQSPVNEIKELLNGLAGGFTPPGPSGAPTRGRLDVLPTGRNFYSVDSRAIPTPAAWELGQRSADQMIMRHLQDHGEYPESMGISVWGTSTMRTGGDDIAQAFALLGVKPVWAPGSNRVVDFEIIPNFLMNRPRVDVTLRVSGFFRDAFPSVMQLFDAAITLLATHEEPGHTNTLKPRIEAEVNRLKATGIDHAKAFREATYRVFGSKPGAYGAGLQGLIDERCWDNQADLATAYRNWGGYAYGQNNSGTEAFSAFQHRLSQLDAVVQNQDNREHDLLDSDDYYQFQGGMANAVTVFSEKAPTIYHNDHANPAQPVTRTLKEELNRVIRSRVLNPKWLEGMQRHGYKGAFEMAATVDYLFAYDATTHLIDDYQYAAVTDHLLLNPQNRDFLETHNPEALVEMAERLVEAQQRGLWENPGEYAEQLEDLIIEIDNRQEQGQ
ncbi:MAG: cobaltochelatase subunit CobN [Pseudomonadales bacterium]|nr:cobaltochelatase subunit CobN [Pseudomonadales bacterium]